MIIKIVNFIEIWSYNSVTCPNLDACIILELRIVIILRDWDQQTDEKTRRVGSMSKNTVSKAQDK